MTLSKSHILTLKREIIQYMECPICKGHRLTIDIRRFTIQCRKCMSYWIWSERIKRTPTGILSLVSNAELKKAKQNLMIPKYR